MLDYGSSAHFISRRTAQNLPSSFLGGGKKISIGTANGSTEAVGVNDLFAFVIKMPTLHRLSVFRDDLVFAVFLYQRWAYREDKTRVNEFGFSAEPPPGETGAAASDEGAAGGGEDGAVAAEEVPAGKVSEVPVESKKDR